jgi:hypothetical protein
MRDAYAAADHSRSAGVIPPALRQRLLVLDSETVVFTHFSGGRRGEDQGHELTNDPALIAWCVAAFEEAWSVAVRNGEYDGKQAGPRAVMDE